MKQNKDDGERYIFQIPNLGQRMVKADYCFSSLVQLAYINKDHGLQRNTVRSSQRTVQRSGLCF
ncbi:hypothetical protein [Paenibacillus senegalensis]|uniref:hypothetical protein n=1 Tax=Paenibacillus senegalensis TaxID=1465766 RepID=UPI0002890D04|nr:hypothetical protein [Paenibacillus senegalensis]